MNIECHPQQRSARFESRGRESSAALSLYVLALAGVGSISCHEDLERFDTRDNGPFCGNIIPSEFTREGYAADLSLELNLDIALLDTKPGTLTLADSETGPCSPLATFDGAEIHITPSLFSDPFSDLQFGRSREHNFVGWVDSQCGESNLAVISLMHDSSVEVRLLSRGEPNSTGGNFGVFQLTRESCDN